MDLRLALLRQLAEVLAYAHGRRLYHRALAPQAILVRDPDADMPSLQVMSWQTAARETTAGATSARATGTQHLERYIDEPSQVYLAPEATRPDIAAGPHMDVFSLGAIAFHLFTGRPPADSRLELTVSAKSCCRSSTIWKARASRIATSSPRTSASPPARISD